MCTSIVLAVLLEGKTETNLGSALDLVDNSRMDGRILLLVLHAHPREA